MENLIKNQQKEVPYLKADRLEYVADTDNGPYSPRTHTSAEQGGLGHDQRKIRTTTGLGGIRCCRQ